MGAIGPATQAAGPHVSDRRLYKCHTAPPSARRIKSKVRGQKSQAQTASGNACCALALSHPKATQAAGQHAAAAQHDTSAQQATGVKPEAQQMDGDVESMDWSVSAKANGSNVALQQISNAAMPVDSNSWSIPAPFNMSAKQASPKSPFVTSSFSDPALRDEITSMSVSLKVSHAALFRHPDLQEAGAKLLSQLQAAYGVTASLSSQNCGDKQHCFINHLKVQVTAVLPLAKGSCSLGITDMWRTYLPACPTSTAH